MKITFVRHSLLNRGGDKMIVAYASYLAAAGHSVVLKTNLVDSVFKPGPGVVIEALRIPGKLGTILSVLMAPIDADLVVADIIPMAFSLSLQNRNRVLYFAQDYNENSYDAVLQKWFIRLLYAASFAWLRVAVVAVSDELAQLFRQRFGKKAQVVYNGVDLDTFYRDPSEDLLREKGGSKVLLFFSRRDARKGFDLALATVAGLVAAQFPSLIVWTVGEGLKEGEVPCPRRDFGYVGESELRRIMSSADLFLYPSRNEGFPLMVLEAFACKCPVVTTEAIPYALDGVNSLVAPVEDVEALVANSTRLLTDTGFARELTDSAYGFVAPYSLRESSLKFMKCVSDIVTKTCQD